LAKSQKILTELEQKINAPDFWQNQAKARELSQQYENLKKELALWQELADETDDLAELSELATSVDEPELQEKYKALEEKYQQLEFFLLFSGQYDKSSAIISIHAGTGGVDAQDWAQMLLRMYLRFSERHGFTTKIIDETLAAEAGLKSVVVEIFGPYAYGWLKSENGVHRLVRISPFDAEKMRHTSFALVEVLPELPETEAIEIKNEDLKIEVMRASGHGGQSVNTTDSAVRITHLPSDIAVKCQNERSQLQNKNNALKIIKAKLFDFYQQADSDKKQKIKGEHRRAEWGNQARSYVLQPYKLVKDHRTGYESVETAKVLDGELDDFVKSYLLLKSAK